MGVQFEPQLVFVTKEELEMNGIDINQNNTSLPLLDNVNNPESLNWQSLGWIELNPSNPSPLQTQMFGIENIQNVTLQKLKKELDLDHVIAEYTKLITGLNDILSDVDGKFTFIRVRIRKLVKFE